MKEAGTSRTERSIAAALSLRHAVERMEFGAPAAYVYCPLTYAWPMHHAYLQRFARSRKRTVFLGMNPGPFGMAQTGIPFGEIKTVREWLRLKADIGRPALEHPKRPVEGLACTRSEVSGRRLWGLFAQRFGTADAFFEDHFVVNYCPLLFVGESGANLTPDKLPARSVRPLYAACDDHLRALVAALEPEWVVGVGGFAADRAADALEGLGVRVGRILHPSPASPAANRGWSVAAERELAAAGIWS